MILLVSEWVISLAIRTLNKIRSKLVRCILIREFHLDQADTIKIKLIKLRSSGFDFYLIWMISNKLIQIE